jgi:hypothetical protein
VVASNLFTCSCIELNWVAQPTGVVDGVEFTPETIRADNASKLLFKEFINAS